MDFLISAWNPPIPLPGMTGELLILQVSAQILPPPGSLGRSGPTFCSASNIPLHSSHCRDYVWLSDTPQIRTQWAPSIIRELKDREAKQYTQASCTNWKPFFCCWTGNWEFTLMQFVWIPWYAFLTKVTSETSGVGTGRLMRSLSGLLSNVFSTMHSQEPFQNTRLIISFFFSISHTTSFLKPFMAPYYFQVKTKQALPNVTYTTWSFLQLLFYIVPLSVLQPHWPFLGLLILVFQAHCRAPVYFSGKFFPFFFTWSLHPYPTSSALLLP